MHGTLIDTLSVQQVDHYNLPLIRQFYKKNGMRAQAPKNELIYSARLKQQSGQPLVAALRLSPVGDDYLLRSMCVSVDQRRQGIGQQFLQTLQPVLASHNVYCFPFSHLLDFYQQANFALITTEDAPPGIADKFLRYLNNGKDLCLMQYQTQATPEQC
jgi:N-acetylglutamate synthase-like GNAT family acetyltransferase